MLGLRAPLFISEDLFATKITAPPGCHASGHPGFHIRKFSITREYTSEIRVEHRTTLSLFLQKTLLYLVILK